jgi:hypothetical protein
VTDPAFLNCQVRTCEFSKIAYLKQGNEKYHLFETTESRKRNSKVGLVKS